MEDEPRVINPYESPRSNEVCVEGNRGLYSEMKTIAYLAIPFWAIDVYTNIRVNHGGLVSFLGDLFR